MEDGQADQGCHYHGEDTRGGKSDDVELLARKNGVRAAIVYRAPESVQGGCTVGM